MKSVQVVNTSIVSTNKENQNSLAVQQFINLARSNVWDISILGKAPMPTEPKRLHDWLIVPADQDTTPIPPQAMNRMRAIKKSGIKIKGFVIVHEAPMLLPAPKIEEKPFLETIDWGEVRRTMGEGLIEIVKVTGTILGGLAKGVLGTIFIGLALLDPICIVVLEDDTWIELYRWLN